MKQGINSRSEDRPAVGQFLGRGAIALMLVGLGAITLLGVTLPQQSAQPVSPLAGLVALRQSAASATPYSVAMANGQPTLIEFYADWCTTCQAMAPTLQAVRDTFHPDLNVVMLDIDDPRWQPQIDLFQVQGVPHVVLLDDQQAPVETFIGKVPYPVLSQRIGALLAESPQVYWPPAEAMAVGGSGAGSLLSR